MIPRARSPTHIPQIARRRVCDYVTETGERRFTANDVAVDFLTLKRLRHSGLLKSSVEQNDESSQTYFLLPEGATDQQEARFARELTRIRAWSVASRKYVFFPRNVKIRREVLDLMANGGLLEKMGRRYRVLWRSLCGRWRAKVKND